MPFQTVLNNLNDRYRNVERHRLLPIPRTLKKKWPQKPCIICRKDGQLRRDTRYYCDACNVALCKNICFETYHKLDDKILSHTLIYVFQKELLFYRLLKRILILSIFLCIFL